jgi:hypothetical protein
MTDLQQRVLQSFGQEPLSVEAIAADLGEPPRDVRRALVDAHRRGWVISIVASLHARWRITDAGRRALSEAEPGGGLGSRVHLSSCE